MRCAIMLVIGVDSHAGGALAQVPAMSGGQKATILILLCAVVIVFIALFLLLEGSLSGTPASSPSPLVLHTPTSTATATATVSPSVSTEPLVSATPTVADTAVPTLGATHTPVSSPTPSETATLTASPTPTETSSHTATPRAGATVPLEVANYLEEFVDLVKNVHHMQLLAQATQVDEGTVDHLRGVYRRLHEMEVPEDAEEMHLAFVIYVSLLEEKCLCQIFGEMHAADAQGQYYYECQNRAAAAATDIIANRFIPGREQFLQRYGVNAPELGFPY